MVILGLLIILVAIAAGAVVYLGAASLSDTFTFDVLGAQVTTNPLGFVLGSAVVVLLLWLGWSIVRVGMRRNARRRRDHKEAERQAEIERTEAEQRRGEELAARERELQEERDRAQAEADRLRAEADARLEEQHMATETARQRAQVAEDELKSREDTNATRAPEGDEAVTPPGQTPPPPPPNATRS